MPQYYVLNPEAGTFDLQGPFGETIGSYPIAPAPYQGWVVDQHGFYDPNAPTTNYEPLSTIGETSLVADESGSASFNREIQLTSLNTGTSTRLQYGVAANISYVDEYGEERSIPIDFAPIAPVGRRLVWYERANGDLAMGTVPANSTLGDLQARSGAYLRWATPQEAAQYAMSGVINQLHPGDVVAYAEANGLLKENGDVDYSSALATLISTEPTDLRAYSTVVKRV